MFDFLRIAAAVPKISIGDTITNADTICTMAKTANNQSADIIIFPELSVTGYTCGDLFFQNELINSAISGLEKIIENSKTINAVIVVGSPLKIDGQLYNCALVIYQSKILGIIPKTFIPTYNEFYEKRWFSSSNDLNIKEISLSALGFNTQNDYTVAIGNELIFEAMGTAFGCEICEDLWTPLSPGTFLAINGAEVILNLSASNETISKRQYRLDLVKQQSASKICAYAFVSAGCTESTTDLIFSGHSIIAENGTIVAENSKTIDGDYIIYGDIDLGKIKCDRKKIKTFNDSKATYGNIMQSRKIIVHGITAKCDGKFINVSKYPFVPSSKSDRIKRCLDIFEMQVMGLKKRMEITRSNPVIGVSGGLDSTLALLVCTEAAKRSGIPVSDVIGITMPCFGTTDRTYNNALKLMKTLGITSKEINIKSAVDGHFSDIGHDKNVTDLTYENSQARERTQVLMDYAGEVGGFVAGTGDLSELALGWCTYNADHMSMYGVNCGVPKTLVRWLIDSIVEYNIFSESSEVLRDILDTPISPELLPPDKNGNIAQQTEDIIGPYALHDFFLYYGIRYGFEPEKIFYLAQKAFNGNYDNATVKKWLVSFYKRFFNQQFKRSCLPDGVKIGSICLSPRGDWRMPSDASSRIWIEKAESIKL